MQLTYKGKTKRLILVPESSDFSLRSGSPVGLGLLREPGYHGMF